MKNLSLLPLVFLLFCQSLLFRQKFPPTLEGYILRQQEKESKHSLKQETLVYEKETDDIIKVEISHFKNEEEALGRFVKERHQAGKTYSYQSEKVRWGFIKYNLRQAVVWYNLSCYFFESNHEKPRQFWTNWLNLFFADMQAGKARPVVFQIFYSEEVLPEALNYDETSGFFYAPYMIHGILKLRFFKDEKAATNEVLSLSKKESFYTEYLLGYPVSLGHRQISAAYGHHLIVLELGLEDPALRQEMIKILQRLPPP
ncbi:MAG: hypothetical protein NZM25_11200 [Leptospiraceae bacterium]|nr:hypothetical protein [Leptospiraceae bacterium]MDW8307579.1 hypothetical protein [Leptospiraceae bacterium]